jgi:hypothetical protein
MKTNIELARECQLLDGLAVVPSQVDRYTAAVEARLMAKLLEGAGEPLGYVSTHTSCPPQFSKTFSGVYRDTALTIDVVYTADRIAAANTRRKEAQAECEVLKKRLVRADLEKRQAVREAVLREREECANLCEAIRKESEGPAFQGASRDYMDGRAMGAETCRADIQNRGTK